MLETKLVKRGGRYTPSMYTKTSIDTQRDNADIVVEYCNGGSFTIKNQGGVDLGGKRGIKEVYENGFIEVTPKKLAYLRSKYEVF